MLQLNLAKENNSDLNGWVIDNNNEPKQNGENRKSPIGFYRKNDFEIKTGVQLKKKNINGVKITWKASEN